MDGIVLERRAVVLKAMAHIARLKIIEELSLGEKCPFELQKVIDLKLPTISRHLLQMKNAGIIKGRKSGNQIYYRLICPCIVEAFHCIDRVIINKGG